MFTGMMIKVTEKNATAEKRMIVFVNPINLYVKGFCWQIEGWFYFLAAF